jgi:hypothetical protein
VNTFAQERPPGFVAACLAASSAHVLAFILVGVVTVPLSLLTWSAVVLSAEPSGLDFGLLLPWLLVFALEPFLAAWIAQRGLALFDAGKVTYARAWSAMVLALVVTAVSALVLPAEAALPVLGYAWTGALAAAAILAAQPRASSKSA